MVKFITALTFLILFFQPYSQTFAKITNELVSKEELRSLGFTRYALINPNSLLYQFKRLSEEIRLMLIFNNKDEERYYGHLFDIRFKELIYIINSKKTGFLEETVNRYNVFTGKIKPYYKNIDTQSQNKINKYIGILEKLRDMYPANSSYWLSIQQAIDSTRGLL